MKSIITMVYLQIYLRKKVSYIVIILFNKFMFKRRSVSSYILVGIIYGTIVTSYSEFIIILSYLQSN